MTTLVLVLIAGAVILLGVWLILGRVEAGNMFSEYEEKFPGKCALCAYHAYGIREGHVDSGTVPEDHRCPEKWARWKGALHR